VRRLRPRRRAIVLALHDLTGQLVRLTADGALDDAYGTMGRFALPTTGGVDAMALALALDTGSRAVAAGWIANASGMESGIVWRVSPTAALDTTFGAGGASMILPAVFVVRVGDDGSITFGGRDASSAPSLARVDETGAPDASFGAGGTVTITGLPSGSSWNLTDLARTDAGTVLLSTDSVQSELVRVTATGAADTTFGTTGAVTIDHVLGVALEAIGPDVVVTGTSSAGPWIGRYDGTGQPVTGFGHALGTFSSSGNGAPLAIDAMGRVLVAASVGGATRDLVLLRVRSDGTLDPSFGAGGVVTLPSDPAFASMGRTVVAVAIQSDGRIVVAGRVYGQGIVLARFWP
jgi:uncharacterized delta-60 repeat protein